MTSDDPAHLKPPLRAPDLRALEAAGVRALETADPAARPGDEDRYEQTRFEGVDWTGVEAEHVEIDGSMLSRARLTGARLPSVRLADVAIEASDAANAAAPDSTWLRAEVAGSKLLGLDLGGASLQHVRFTDCNLMLASLRFARLRRVAFVGCDLRQATLQGAELRDCEFIGCDLAETQFSQSTHRDTDLRGSKLEGVQGLESLRGAVVDASQLVDLAPAMAATIGLRVADPLDPEA